MNVKEKKNSPLFATSKTSGSNSEIYDNTWKACSQHILVLKDKSKSLNVNFLG